MSLTNQDHAARLRLPLTEATGRRAALGFIGADANGPLMPTVNSDAGQSSGEGGNHQTRDAAPGTPGDGWDAASNGLLLRTADVRSVRREERPHPVTKEMRRLVVADWVASTESVDSYESILIADWDKAGGLDQFRRNPVLLWAHDRSLSGSRPAIGHCENVRVEKNELLLTVVCDDTTEFDREIADKIEKRVLRAGSVGFDWTKAELRTIGDREVVVFSGNSLREFSVCNIGSNNDALSQRDFVHVVRDLARTHGAVGTRDVVAAYRARHARPPRAANPPAPPATPITRAPQPGAPKDLTMKTFPIDVRAHRASPATPAACPACNEAVVVQLTNVPEPDEKAIADLTTRAATAEGKLTETTRALDLVTQEKTAAETRAAALEARVATAEKFVEAARAERVTAEIEKRIGTKIEPAEKDDEIKLARTLLADATPDPDKVGSTLGEKAFAARLAKIDGRRDLGVLGGPITGGDKHNTGAGHEPQARNLAADIDAMLAKQTGAAFPS